jgi:hypothetical protein
MNVRNRCSGVGLNPLTIPGWTRFKRSHKIPNEDKLPFKHSNLCRNVLKLTIKDRDVKKNTTINN